MCEKISIERGGAGKKNGIIKDGEEVRTKKK